MFDVHVQGHPLKTPQGRRFQTPTLALATAIEEEWRRDPAPDFRQKPLTSLAATALDQGADARDSFITYGLDSIARDCLLFWESTPSSLVTHQEEQWAPFIEEVNRRLNLTLKPTFSLSQPSLSPPEVKRVKAFLDPLADFQLIGFCHLLTLTSSFCLSYLVFENCLSPDTAWQAAHLHEHTQRTRWGQDEEALLQEKHHYDEFLGTVQFLRLV